MITRSFQIQLCCTFFLAVVLLSLEVYAKVEPHEDHFYQHEHYTGADHQHDVRYDHDAFLGPEASKFEEFPPEESKRKLRVIITSKIDLDKDGLVTLKELEAWIEKQRKGFMYEAVDESILKQDKDGDGLITWEEFREGFFGKWDNDNLPEDHSLRRRIQKMKHKFGLSDEDKDGKMNRDEYVNFEHPEETEHMTEIALDEIIDEVDQNGDRLIDMAEFLGQYGEDDTPQWVIRQRKEFASTFDKDKNGKLDREEIKAWALPQKGESLDEAMHLIDGSDEDADGSLSVDEMLLHWDLFVGSKVTDHGETLRQMKHDEF